MPRFAILEHDHPQRHWDLLLEAGSACRTWRLAAPPEDGTTIPAEVAADHRLLYLEYEGPVSGGRGTVNQWDAGRLVWITATEAHVVVLLAGRQLNGRLELIQTSSAWSARYRRR